MGLQDLRDQVCIVGVGDTKQGVVPDKTGDELGIDAARAKGPREVFIILISGHFY